MRLGARAAFTDSTYGDFVTPNVFEEGGETINGVDNLLQLDGNEVQLSPKYNITLLASYEFDLGDKGRIVPATSIQLSDSYTTNDLLFRLVRKIAIKNTMPALHGIRPIMSGPYAHMFKMQVMSLFCLERFALAVT